MLNHVHYMIIHELDKPALSSVRALYNMLCLRYVCEDALKQFARINY